MAALVGSTESCITGMGVMVAAGGCVGPGFGRRASRVGVSPAYAAGSTGLSQCEARVSLGICTSRSESTSSTFFSENGMILVPWQWWPSTATSMNAI